MGGGASIGHVFILRGKEWVGVKVKEVKVITIHNNNNNLSILSLEPLNPTNQSPFSVSTKQNNQTEHNKRLINFFFFW
jgi:hypothetical protein